MKNDRDKVLPDLIPNIGFNLKAQEAFATDHGIIIEHWAAVPSPIGKKDRGDYRRPDKLDTIAENGFVYKKVGEFVGTILGNGRSNNHGAAEGGIYDDSTSRLTMPKFYKSLCSGSKDPKEISLLPGDRLYTAQLETKVANYQEAQYNPSGTDYLQFPASCVEQLIDSRGIEYKEGKHFVVDNNGNIKWKNGQNNPGVDPDTGKGRIYGVRYQYRAFWYVQRLLNEIRITNEGDSSTPTRLPYQAVIQREYVYHNSNRNQEQAINNTLEKPRTIPEPTEQVVKKPGLIKVDVKDYE
jgi:hypothetical protein